MNYPQYREVEYQYIVGHALDKIKGHFFMYNGDVYVLKDWTDRLVDIGNDIKYTFKFHAIHGNKELIRGVAISKAEISRDRPLEGFSKMLTVLAETDGIIMLTDEQLSNKGFQAIYL